uniref:basic proline-rich protein-like isoform X2 n=1 Tax=Halichoerus grypus TaxID=9711 RepID=UPI0016599874|nr:basic proline-rich protein-like isoform X2 [Halichoerus grypus]
MVPPSGGAARPGNTAVHGQWRPGSLGTSAADAAPPATRSPAGRRPPPRAAPRRAPPRARPSSAPALRPASLPGPQPTPRSGRKRTDALPGRGFEQPCRGPRPRGGKAAFRRVPPWRPERVNATECPVSRRGLEGPARLGELLSPPRVPAPGGAARPAGTCVAFGRLAAPNPPSPARRGGRPCARGALGLPGACVPVGIGGPRGLVPSSGPRVPHSDHVFLVST